MSKYLSLYVLIHLLISPITLAIDKENIELVSKIATITDATPIKRFPPKYPINEARAGRDGWVVVSYIVEPDGSTSNMLIESSSGSKGFEKEARRAIKRWKFQPAIENGEAIQQCKNTVQLDYIMHREQDGVSKKFLRLFNKAHESLKQEETENSREVFEKIKNWKQYTHLESFYKYSILAKYQGKLKNKEKQLSYINQALRFSGIADFFKKLKNETTISANGIMLKAGTNREEQISKIETDAAMKKDKLFFPILHQKLRLEIEFNAVSDALDSINSLLLLSSSKPYHSSYIKQKQILESFINGDKQLITTAHIFENDFWHYKLLRNQFSFTDIVGKLTKVDLRCSNKRHVYTINESSTWKIPKRWKDCSIYVYGEDNASFTLIELNEAAKDNNTLASVNK